MKIFVILITLWLSLAVQASESCRELNTHLYTDEITLTPTGKIYRVTGPKKLYIYYAPNLKCRPKTMDFIINGDEVQAYTEYKDFFSIMYFKKDGTTIEGWVLKKRLIETAESSSHSEQYE